MRTKPARDALGRRFYYQTPEFEADIDNFYIDQSRLVLTELGRSELESRVNNWVIANAQQLCDDKHRWRAKRYEPIGFPTDPSQYYQKWPWSCKTRATPTIFVPSHYGLAAKSTQFSRLSDQVIHGIYLRVSEDRELLWQPAQAPLPDWYDAEAGHSQERFSWHFLKTESLTWSYERALVEQVSNLMLASIYITCMVHTY